MQTEVTEMKMGQSILTLKPFVPNYPFGTLEREPKLSFWHHGAEGEIILKDT